MHVMHTDESSNSDINGVLWQKNVILIKASYMTFSDYLQYKSFTSAFKFDGNRHKIGIAVVCVK